MTVSAHHLGSSTTLAKIRYSHSSPPLPSAHTEKYLYDMNAPAYFFTESLGLKRYKIPNLSAERIPGM